MESISKLSLEKTMIVCNNQTQAKVIYKELKDMGKATVCSISDFSEGSTEAEAFKLNPKIQFFIVVNRGILGFDFPELDCLIDVSETLNVNRIFQMLCRVIRKNRQHPNKVKRFIKLSSPTLASYTYLTMSYVVALSDPAHYYTFEKKYLATTKTTFAIDKRAYNLFDGDYIRNRRLEDFPPLLTFKDIQASRDGGGMKVYAQTNFKRVQAMLVGKEMRTVWTLEDAISVAKRYPNIITFAQANQSCYNWFRTHHIDELHKILPSARYRWNKMSDAQLSEIIKPFKTLHELEDTNHPLYAHIYNKKRHHLIDHLRPKKPSLKEAIAILKKCRTLKAFEMKKMAKNVLLDGGKSDLLEQIKGQKRTKFPVSDEQINRVTELRKTMGAQEACKVVGINYQTWHSRAIRRRTDRIKAIEADPTTFKTVGNKGGRRITPLTPAQIKNLKRLRKQIGIMATLREMKIPASTYYWHKRKELV